MEKMWAVSASVRIKRDDGWTSVIQIPTFYLHRNVQGILTADQAEEVAANIINPGNIPGVEVHAFRVQVEV